MMARFPEVARGFCRDWFSAATAALASAPEPEDPFAARNFWIALGGNMLWASTSLTSALTATPGPAVAGVVGASAGGAALGSGVLANAAPPSGKAAVTDKLASMRDQLETRVTQKGFFVDVVQNAVTDPTASGDINAQDKLLWNKFADAKVSFESKVATMTTILRAILADYLVQFQKEFLEWKARDDVIKKAREHELAEQSSGPFGDVWDILGDVLGIGTPADRFFEMAMSDIPFEPTFVTNPSLAP
jgi:hypothetical protein